MDKNEERQKAFINAATQAYVTTAMERDKSLLSIASAAIGLLVTLAISVKISTKLEFSLLSISFLSFIVTVISAIMIFTFNQDFLLDEISDKKPSKSTLALLDKVIVTSFIFGIICTSSFAICKSFEIQQKTNQSTEDKQVAKKEISTESLKDIGKIKESSSSSSGQKSLKDIGKLKPKTDTTSVDDEK